MKLLPNIPWHAPKYDPLILLIRSHYANTVALHLSCPWTITGLHLQRNREHSNHPSTFFNFPSIRIRVQQEPTVLA